jgi:hypothetical protein
MVSKLQRELKAATKPRPMSEAPRDGSILVKGRNDGIWFQVESLAPYVGQTRDWRDTLYEEHKAADLECWIPLPTSSGGEVGR